MRVPRARSWADLSITRTLDWGSLARFWVLDTRQFRSDQPCDDGTRTVPCGNWADPSQTLLGAAQERWVADGLGASRASWQVLAQQIMVAPFDAHPGDGVRVSRTWNSARLPNRSRRNSCSAGPAGIDERRSGMNS